MPEVIQPLTVDRSHGGGEELGEQAGLIDFSTSLNPLGPPEEAKEAYQKAVGKISLYPPPYPRQLESRIAQWLGIDPLFVLAGNGSTQLIYLVARVLKPHSPRVVIPTFSEIANGLIAAGSQALPLQTFPENDFHLNSKDVGEALESGADAIFLGRPNNPTGGLIRLDEAHEIAAQCHRHDAWCIFDEAFIEFADDPRSVVTLMAYFPKLVVFRSLTKIFAIAGLRLGYLVSHPQNISLMRNAIEPWSVNVAAEVVATACVGVPPGFIERTREMIMHQRRWIEEELGRLRKFRVFPGSANFIMIEVLKEHRIGEFADHLQKRRIAIRDLRAMQGGGPGFYRLGVRNPSDNRRFIAAASEF